ncbi:MAG TPA: hypothetical protein VND65_01770 [Candidatus Binatia bacterium]|nr:hypothetical protein [Candidatus Binatia bacterium]
MTGEKPTPPYAAELARIAVFTMQRVQRNEKTVQERPIPVVAAHIPDEVDFEKEFKDIVQQIRLEAQMEIYKGLSLFKDAVGVVNELQEVTNRINAHHAEVGYVPIIRRS